MTGSWPYKFIRKNLSLILLVFFLFGMRWSFADQYVVPSGSMEPTLEVGDRILVNKMAYNFKIPYTNWIVARRGEPERGDVIVFSAPTNPPVTMVKRVVALPGDEVLIQDGFIRVNGAMIEGSEDGAELVSSVITGSDEEFVLMDTEVKYQETYGSKAVTIKRTPFAANAERLEFVVPNDSYFAMGDNRDNSADSRSWGFIPRDGLKGRTFAVGWSLRFNGIVPKANWARFGLKVN